VPAPQEAPHFPQFETSLARSTQAPPQLVLPPEQPHAPAAQVVPPGQVTPQPPQFVLLVWVSVQLAPQSVSAPQTPVQTPALQVEPGAQTFPQPPQ
jgi:hypothetical protein